MTNEALPIVFRQKPRDAWVVLALGGALLVAGIAMTFDSATLISVFGLFRAPRSWIGWPVALLGLVMVAVAANAIARGLPRLELREKGIVLTNRLGGVTRVAWHEVARVDIQHMETMGAPSTLHGVASPARAGTVTFESVAIVTTDGRKVPISELGPAEEMREVIMRGRNFLR